MAVTFGVKDAYSVMNSLVRQATGQTDLTATDTSSFIDCGTKVLEAGTENLFNALGVLIGRTIVATRPYTGKYKLISAPTGDIYETRIRKISIYARDNQKSGMYNTDQATNLGAGLDDEDGVGSQWEQNPAIPVERYFYSQFAWDKSHTQYPEQVKLAFRSEAEFIKFINGVMVEVQNDIESTIEARNRMVVLDRIAGSYLQSQDRPECAVNLTKEFNDAHGTAYTTQEIIEEHTVAFLEFFVARFKIDSDKLENRTAKYHDPMAKTISGVDYHVLRHTPKSKQKFIYYSPIFTQMKLSLAEIFNPQMLDLPNGEGIQFWQAFDKPSEISVIPALPEGKTGDKVAIKLVLGLLFDTDALMTRNLFNGVYTTPINARHVYQNIFWHYNFGVINDYSENSILYYMADQEVFEATGDGATTDFTITDKPALIDKVTVDGTEVAADDYEYTPATGVISFDTAPANSKAIKVYYTA